MPKALKYPRIVLAILGIFLVWSGGGCEQSQAIVPLPPSPSVCPPQECNTHPQEDPEMNHEIAALAQAHSLRLPHDRVLLTRMLGKKPDLVDVVRTTPLRAGSKESFWVSNISRNENRQITATLRYAGPVVLVYVEEPLTINQQTLEQTVRTFENDIYPRSRSLFGSEWQPGVDGDTRITILHTRREDDATIGYFSARDSVPREANRFSNEREMFVMKITPDNPSYLSVLAHEFQHMIHWNEQRRSQTWFNEGCSMLNQDLNGYPDQFFAQSYLANPNTPLTGWESTSANSLEHYGASNLFLRYLYGHYIAPNRNPGDNEGSRDLDQLRALLRADASNYPTSFVELAKKHHPDITNFGMLIGNWAVANMLDDSELDDGRYGYPPGIPPLPHPIAPQKVPFDAKVGKGELTDTLAQFGAAYWDLPPGPLHITFTGNLTVPLVGAFPTGAQAWWSGRGDGIISTLTRPFDFRDMSQSKPGLRFNLWYDLEQDYDYAFVSVSTDNGNTWQTLSGRHTTSADPHGANYEHGWNGMSGNQPGAPGWVEETIDLSPYSGEQGYIRFWLITDEAINLPGLLLEKLRLCDGKNESSVACVSWDVGENGLEKQGGSDGLEGWKSGGFVRVDGDLPQWWEVRLIRSAGGEKRVERLVPGNQYTFSATLAQHERGTLVIVPTTPYTTEPASYRLDCESL